MKIGVAFTGGTIGSAVVSSGYIAPDKSKPFRLIEMYREYCQGCGRNNSEDIENIEFVTFDIYRILSEMLDAAHIVTLVNYIKKLVQTNLDGIIVTHGTDTLQYSAAMLSYALGTDSIPVVLVSADYPLEDKRSNGLENFICAVEVIRQSAGKGVFISYKNKDDEFVTIHRATRTLAHLPYSSSVFSVDNQYYARFIRDIFEYNKDYTVCGKNGMKPFVLNEKEFAKAESFIQRISVYPGMKYPKAFSETKAVLIESYHSGTLCTDERFEKYIKELSEKGISVFVIGADNRNTAYETTESYGRLGLKILPRISPVAAYCKLWLLFSNKRSPDDMMICMSEDFA